MHIDRLNYDNNLKRYLLLCWLFRGKKRGIERLNNRFKLTHSWWVEEMKFKKNQTGKSITVALNHLKCHWIFQVVLWQELGKNGTDSKFIIGNLNRQLEFESSCEGRQLVHLLFHSCFLVLNEGTSARISFNALVEFLLGSMSGPWPSADWVLVGMLVQEHSRKP